VAEEDGANQDDDDVTPIYEDFLKINKQNQTLAAGQANEHFNSD